MILYELNIYQKAKSQISKEEKGKGKERLNRLINKETESIYVKMNKNQGILFSNDITQIKIKGDDMIRMGFPVPETCRHMIYINLIQKNDDDMINSYWIVYNINLKEIYLSFKSSPSKYTLLYPRASPSSKIQNLSEVCIYLNEEKTIRIQIDNYSIMNKNKKQIEDESILDFIEYNKDSSKELKELIGKKRIKIISDDEENVEKEEKKEKDEMEEMEEIYDDIIDNYLSSYDIKLNESINFGNRHKRRLTKPKNKEKLNKQIEKCSICLEIIHNEAKLNSCSHTFCYECIIQFSKLENKCPLCKRDYSNIIYYDSKDSLRIIRIKKKRLKETLSEYIFNEDDGLNNEINEDSIFNDDLNDSDACYECFKNNDQSNLLICDKCNISVCHYYCDHLNSLPTESEEWVCFFCRGMKE